MTLRIKTESLGDMFKFENVGDKLKGYYQGSAEHNGDFGPTQKHIFQTDKGLKTVFGQTHLTQLLAGEKPGVYMEVTYTGTKKGKKGNPMKTYQLAVDDANVSEVVTEDAYEPSEDAEEAYSPPKAAAPSRPVATPTVANQANAARLLNRNKSA